MAFDPAALHPWAAYLIPQPEFQGGHRLTLLRGGEQLFADMLQALDEAQREVWLATYIFHDDACAAALAEALARAARRGVRVRVVIDGFGSHHSRAWLESQLTPAGVALVVFRPLDHWTHWLQPGQMRRLHMKLCVVDGQRGYVGGINLIDDHIDLRHGRSDTPRLDYAVRVEGPLVTAMAQATRAMWSRAWFGRDWRQETRTLLAARQPLAELRRLWRQLRLSRRARAARPVPQPPVVAALVVRDNLRQRRTIERAHIDAIRGARQRIWLVTPYFYPGRELRQALREAAARGVEVKLLLQGKVDYRLAAWAARVTYAELLAHGVQVHEYTPAFLHAKVMLVDTQWATVGSSNLDPLSLLLNLEANLIVRDTTFSQALATELEAALAASRQVPHDEVRGEFRWIRLTRRALVAWVAYVYLRLAGVTGRY